VFVCITWFSSVPFIQSSHQSVKANENCKILDMWSSPFTTCKQILDQLLLNPLMCFHPYNLHAHRHTHTITHTLGICRIRTMNVFMFYHTTFFTDCLMTLIVYMHTPHCAYVDVLPIDTLAWMPYYPCHQQSVSHHYAGSDEFSNHPFAWII
jgi:hypothetical protein